MLQLIKSPYVYFQNATPLHLITELWRGLKSTPKKILDLCASPGGKTLALHQLCPESEYTVNDISEKKLSRIRDNFNKFGIKAHFSCSSGQEFTSNERYDIIILDVPCSNSGVLNKRPEARWRINADSLASLEKTQMELAENAIKHLAPNGQIWYMTCSILTEENQALVKKICETYQLSCPFNTTVHPNLGGWDGGFAAILNRN